MSLRYGTVVSMEGERQVYRKTTDYIRHSTFPGGMLLCDSAIAKGAAEAGLKVESSFAFGADYACGPRASPGGATGSRASATAARPCATGSTTSRLCAACFAVWRTDVVQVDLSHA